VDVDLPGSGGELIQEQDAYRIPYWSLAFEVPAGQRVREVTLTDRSMLVTDSLALTTTQMFIACASEACPPHQEATAQAQDAGTPTDDAWTPDLERVYEWRVIDNPDGSSTLVVDVYPFHYRPLTGHAQFYKHFEFDIAVLTSTASIDGLALDQAAYGLGEDVAITLWLSSTGAAQDVMVEATIRDGSSDDLVAGLPLRTLHDLAGTASYALTWESVGFPAGDYVVQVALRDSAGHLLDRAMEDFRLGIATGEVTAFSATPGLFQVGDAVDIAMTFYNTGTVPLTGTAIIQVQTADGVTVVHTFTHTVANLAPGNTTILNNAWNTTGATDEGYRIVGYVLYDSTATLPETVTVSTRMRVYLPLAIRNHQ
jgi:hypothetical protein